MIASTASETWDPTMRATSAGALNGSAMSSSPGATDTTRPRWRATAATRVRNSCTVGAPASGPSPAPSRPNSRNVKARRNASGSDCTITDRWLTSAVRIRSAAAACPARSRCATCP